jgi:predicted GH43/DUF377 family glycosyl hydrolase
MFKRAKKNPIITPNKKRTWESLKTYNPGVVFYNEKYYLFYRAVDNNKLSCIGLAISSDGVNFRKKLKPIILPNQKYESKGVEDPRVTQISDKFYMTYTAYDGKSARIKWAVSKDLKKWQKLGLMLPDWDAKKAHSFNVPWDQAQNTKTAERKWHKAGGIFPEKINGKFYMLFGDRDLWLAQSNDLKEWQVINDPFLRPRKSNFFDNVHVEMGPPPINTKEAWLVLYHGINQNKEYKLGYLLLDLKNPKKILKRSRKFIFKSSDKYEHKEMVDIISKKNKNRTVPTVIFCNGAVLRKNILEIFYGVSDFVICKASAKLKEVLK